MELIFERSFGIELIKKDYSAKIKTAQQEIDFIFSIC